MRAGVRIPVVALDGLTSCQGSLPKSSPPSCPPPSGLTDTAPPRKCQWETPLLTKPEHPPLSNPEGCQSHQERPLHRVSPSGLPAELGDDKAPTCASVCGFQPRTSLHPWKLRILTRPLLRLCLWDPTRVLQACLDPSSTKKALRYGLCGLRRLHRSVRCNRAALSSPPHQAEGVFGRATVLGLEPRWRYIRAAWPLHPFNFFRVG
jgi:hypothetical protein